MKKGRSKLSNFNNTMHSMDCNDDVDKTHNTNNNNNNNNKNEDENNSKPNNNGAAEEDVENKLHGANCNLFVPNDNGQHLHTEYFELDDLDCKNSESLLGKN